MRDHEKLGAIFTIFTIADIIINCGDYEISNGVLGGAIGTFLKDQIL